MKERTAVGEIRRAGAARARPTGHASLCPAVIFAAVSETKRRERREAARSRLSTKKSTETTEPNATATRSIAMNDAEIVESKLSEDFRDFVMLKGFLIEWAAALHAKSWRIGAQLQSKQIVVTDA